MDTGSALPSPLPLQSPPNANPCPSLLEGLWDWQLEGPGASSPQPATDGDEGTNVQTPPSGGELGTQVSLKDPAVGSTLVTHPSLLAKPLVDQAGGSPVLWAEVERGVPRPSRRWGRGWGSRSAVSPLPGPSRGLWERQQGDDGVNEHWAAGRTPAPRCPDGTGWR